MSARAAWRLESLGFATVYRYQGGRDDWMANGLPIGGRRAQVLRVADVLRRDVPTCPLGTPVAAARRRARDAGWAECVVVNDAGIVLGVAWASALDGDPRALVDDVMDPGPVTERLDSSAEKIARELEEHELSQRIVTTSDGELVGIFFAADVPDRSKAPHAARPKASRRSGM
jgi:CBS domain-containing protein